MNEFELRDRAIRPVLEALGTRVALEVPSVTWHLELSSTQHYEFKALLIFSVPNRDEDAAVLEMALRSASGDWMIDAIDIDAGGLGDSQGTPGVVDQAMTADPQIAAWVLRYVGAELCQAIEHHLKTVVGPPPGTEPNQPYRS